MSISAESDGPSFQVQKVRAGSSCLSMDSVELEFGLGSTSAVDEMGVVWPSGTRQVFTAVAADQGLVVEEPES